MKQNPKGGLSRRLRGYDAGCYERGSLVLTGNKGFADWQEVPGDAGIATAA